MAYSLFKPKACRECGTIFQPRHRTSLFCCVPHKQAFNNRRRERGAELYDFLMVGGTKDDLVKRLIAAYHRADKAKRDGRPSFQDTQTAGLRIPLAYGENGDGR